MSSFKYFVENGKGVVRLDAVFKQFQPTLIKQEQGTDTPPEKPKYQETEDFFIVPFRLLSSHIIKGLGYPIDYSKEGLLESAVTLFSDRTVYPDHCSSVEKWIGVVKNATYNSTSDPKGIDAELWISKQRTGNSDIILGIQCGAITRCSVTISFDWVPSHPDLKQYAFWESLGTEVDGELVRVVVTTIHQIYETSLVWWGADDSAQIKQEKQSVAAPQKEDTTLDKEKMKVFLSKKLGRSITTDAELEKAMDDYSNLVTTLESDKVGLQKEIDRLKQFEKFKTDLISELRTETLGLKTFLGGNTIQQYETDLINNADYPALLIYRNQFQQEKQKTFMATTTCQNCGSKIGEVRSSVDGKPEHHEGNSQSGVADLGFLKRGKNAKK